MPFMLGAANVGAETFDLLLDHSRYDYDLFAPPNPALGTVDHAIGLHASSLVRDSGTCRSASENSAIPSSTRCCCVTAERERRRAAGVGPAPARRLIDAIGGGTSFTGLFGATEMFVDQMLDLYRAGILRRRVYDYLPLQRALAANGSSTRVDAGLLEGLLAAGAGPRLGAEDVAALDTPACCAASAASSPAHRLARRRAHRRGSRQPEDVPRWRANAWDWNCRAAR